MAAEPVAEVEVGHRGGRSDHGVVVQRVVGVVARPRVGHTDPLERRYPVGQRRPDDLFPLLVADREVVGVHLHVVQRRGTGQVVGWFGPDVDSGGVDGQRQGRPVEGLAAGEHEGGADPGFHRQFQAGHFGDPPAPRPGTVHDPTTGHHVARRQLHVGDPPPTILGSGEPQVDHPVGEVLHAVVAGPLLEAPHQAVGIECALVPEAQAGSDQVLHEQVREPVGQIAGGQQGDLGTTGALHLVVLPQDVHAVVGGQEQVAGLPEAQLRGFVFHLDVLVEVGEELGGEHRQPDVHRFGELVADAGLGQRRGGLLVGGVGLDDQHRAVVVGVLGQPVGQRAAHDGPTDDDCVVGGAVGAVQLT